MSSVDELQAAASRYGTSAGFGPLVPTGVVDAATQSAVIKSLSWIRDHVPSETGTAQSLISQLTDLNAVQEHADGLTTYLNQIADSSGIGGSSFDFAPNVQTQLTSFSQAWAQVPTWAKVMGGLGLVAGIFWIGHSVAKRRHPPMPAHAF